MSLFPVTVCHGIRIHSSHLLKNRFRAASQSCKSEPLSKVRELYANHLLSVPWAYIACRGSCRKSLTFAQTFLGLSIVPNGWIRNLPDVEDAIRNEE